MTISNAKLDDPGKLTLALAPFPEAALEVELAVADVRVAPLVEEALPFEAVVVAAVPDPAAVAVAVDAAPVASAAAPH